MAATLPTYVTTTDYTYTYGTTYSSGSYTFTNFQEKRKESKKEKIARIAKENMLASHKTYNQKTPTIKQVKQVCKPIYKIRYFR